MSAIEKRAADIDPMAEWSALRAQADALVKSRFLPRAIDTAEKAVAIMLMGRELGIGPMQALRSIHVIEGKPTMSSELIAGLVLARLPGSTLRVAVSTNDECSVEAARAGQQPMTFRFTIKDAQAAQLSSKDNWKKYPAAMLRARCLTAAARAVFPDATMGMCDPDELGAITDERGEVVELRPVLPIEQQPPRISPHGVDEDEPTPPNADAFDLLLERLVTVENAIPVCASYSEALRLRDVVGTKASQSRLARDIQLAGEAGDLSPSQRQLLGKTWMRCDRQIVKLEEKFKPDVTDSFIDEPDPAEDFDRSL